TAPTRDTQGVASLALGYVPHWAFSPHLLNPKLENLKSFANLPVNPLTCQPVNRKFRQRFTNTFPKKEHTNFSLQ
ncbi:hypothetical protein, partial [Prevotellamassilia timonensis]|uniref:hypothetical protein n=1 Tax=Prevotellamassilia timonensis TaxID=1852370 RepID=UPI0030773927